MCDQLRRARENLTEIVSVLVTGVWLAALFAGQSWWLGFMLFGYIVIVPITGLLAGDQETITEWWGDQEKGSTSEEPSEEEALQTLRKRYARGELTDGEFERKLERLLETESIETTETRPQHTDDRLDRETDKETVGSPTAVTLQILRPTVAVAMKRVIEAIETLPKAGLPRSQRKAYQMTFQKLKAVDADDDDEGIRVISDWILGYIDNKQRPPGSREVRRQAAKFCRTNGYRVHSDEWLGI